MMRSSAARSSSVCRSRGRCGCPSAPRAWSTASSARSRSHSPASLRFHTDRAWARGVFPPTSTVAIAMPAAERGHRPHEAPNDAHDTSLSGVLHRPTRPHKKTGPAPGLSEGVRHLVLCWNSGDLAAPNPRDPRPGLRRSRRTGPRPGPAPARAGAPRRVPDREHRVARTSPRAAAVSALGRPRAPPGSGAAAGGHRAARRAAGRSRRRDGSPRLTYRWSAQSRRTPRPWPPPPRGASPRPRRRGRARPRSSGRAGPASAPGCARTRWNVRCGTRSAGSRATTRGRRPPSARASPARTRPAGPSRRSASRRATPCTASPASAAASRSRRTWPSRARSAPRPPRSDADSRSASSRSEGAHRGCSSTTARRTSFHAARGDLLAFLYTEGPVLRGVINLSTGRTLWRRRTGPCWIATQAYGEGAPELEVASRLP